MLRLSEAEWKSMCRRIMCRLARAAEAGSGSYYTSDLWMRSGGENDPALSMFDACRMLALLRRHKLIKLVSADRVALTWDGRAKIEFFQP